MTGLASSGQVALVTGAGRGDPAGAIVLRHIGDELGKLLAALQAAPA